MSTKRSQRNADLKLKSDRLGLDLPLFRLILELLSDISWHSEGTIEPLLLQKTPEGVSIQLYSASAKYTCQLIRGLESNYRHNASHSGYTLICVRELFGLGSRKIHESDGSVSGFEALRKAMLETAGFEVMSVKQEETSKRSNKTEHDKVAA